MANLLVECEVPVTHEIENSLPGEASVVDLEYQKLCEALCYGNVDTQAFPLARWLRVNEIVVYSDEAITRYLTKLKEKNPEIRTDLAWHPMRSKDKRQYYNTSMYAEPIPKEILRLASHVVEKFKDKVRLEIGVTHTDPFLRIVHSESSEEFVIAHWDEPGFSLI